MKISNRNHCAVDKSCEFCARRTGYGGYAVAIRVGDSSRIFNCVF